MKGLSSVCMHGGKKAIAFGTILKASSEGADYVLKLFEQCIRGPYIVVEAS